MRINLLHVISLVLFNCGAIAQVYNPVNYNFNGTPTNGIKIKTNMPYSNGSQMPTIIIEGYEYGGANTIAVQLGYYIYSGNFIQAKASSSGGYTPIIKLSNEDGKVAIFIDERKYFNRFSVRVIAQGMLEQTTWFQGWTVVDQPISGTNVITVNYENRFAGNIFFPDGIWNQHGSVSIGTTDPKGYKLAVAGKVIAEEVVVKLQSQWPDYVFQPEYNLRPLSEVEAHIHTHGHLPEVPSAQQVEESGIGLGEMNALLLKKVEELTLYSIEQQKEIEELKRHNKRIEELEKQNEMLERQSEEIEELKILIKVILNR